MQTPANKVVGEIWNKQGCLQRREYADGSWETFKGDKMFKDGTFVRIRHSYDDQPAIVYASGTKVWARRPPGTKAEP